MTRTVVSQNVFFLEILVHKIKIQVQRCKHIRYHLQRRIIASFFLFLIMYVMLKEQYLDFKLEYK